MRVIAPFHDRPLDCRDGFYSHFYLWAEHFKQKGFQPYLLLRDDGQYTLVRQITQTEEQQFRQPHTMDILIPPKDHLFYWPEPLSTYCPICTESLEILGKSASDLWCCPSCNIPYNLNDAQIFRDLLISVNHTPKGI